MVTVWCTVFGLVILFYTISQVTSIEFIKSSTFWMISLVLSFSTFVMTTLFSFMILSHNIEMRKMSRNQFLSNNYSVIDFNGDMLLYEQPKNYTEALKKTQDYKFYLHRNIFKLDEVKENFNDFAIISIKLPFRVAEGKSIGDVRISNFKFSRDETDYCFVPCGDGINTMILQDIDGSNKYVLANLIIRKDGDFFVRSGDVTPFGKIRLNLSMRSLLGVEVDGWIELYFINPLKLEKGYINVYKITSSQFKISGLPTLVKEITSEV